MSWGCVAGWRVLSGCGCRTAAGNSFGNGVELGVSARPVRISGSVRRGEDCCGCGVLFHGGGWVILKRRVVLGLSWIIQVVSAALPNVHFRLTAAASTYRTATNENRAISGSGS